MKTVNLAAMNSLDHEDIKDLASGEKQRRKRRLAIIKSFLAWTKAPEQKEKFLPRNNRDEYMILKQQKKHTNMVVGYGLVANFFVYQSLMTGIYNYRSRELINMRRIPFLFKLGFSSCLSGLMCYYLYHDNMYQENLYKLAVKYRPEFDSEFKEQSFASSSGSIFPETTKTENEETKKVEEAS